MPVLAVAHFDKLLRTIRGASSFEMALYGCTACTRVRNAMDRRAVVSTSMPRGMPRTATAVPQTVGMRFWACLQKLYNWSCVVKLPSDGYCNLEFGRLVMQVPSHCTLAEQERAGAEPQARVFFFPLRRSENAPHPRSTVGVVL